MRLWKNGASRPDTASSPRSDPRRSAATPAVVPSTAFVSESGMPVHPQPHRGCTRLGNTVRWMHIVSCLRTRSCAFEPAEASAFPAACWSEEEIPGTGATGSLQFTCNHNSVQELRLEIFDLHKPA
jgi:hypothetical protein